MVFFLAIVASHLTGIAGGLLFFTLNAIVSCCQGRVFFLFELLPLLFFAIGFGGLIRTGRSRGLAIGRLCFLALGHLGAGFLGSGSLDLHL